MRFKGTLKGFNIDLSQPIDISIPLRRAENVNAFHLPDPSFETVVAGDFIGSVEQGGSCNVENLHLNAHGNGTHTECLGHISHTKYYLKDVLRQYHFLALLISAPVNVKEKTNQIEADALNLSQEWLKTNPEALVIRTLPNHASKQTRVYSGSNPPFFTVAAIEKIKAAGIQHLLVDLPSLDKEDDPALSAHHAFFDYPQNSHSERTITELIYVPQSVKDGIYLLNLQVLAIESDASPSHPVLYRLS